MSDPVATNPPPDLAPTAAPGTCGHCKAAVIDSNSLRCTACNKPFAEVGLTPPGGWVRGRMLMWYAVFTTIGATWLTPFGSPIKSLLSVSGFEVFITWGPAFVVIILTSIALAQGVRKARSSPGCGRCAYSIAGLATLTCPECGGDLRLVGISVGKPAAGAFMRQTPTYTAARWLTLVMMAAALTLSAHAFIALPYQYAGSFTTTIPLASPVGTNFIAESTQTLVIDSTIRGPGENKPRPFPQSFVKVTITSGRSPPVLVTLLLGIDEDLMIDGPSPDGPQQVLSTASLKAVIQQLIPTLSNDEARFSALRIIMANRPMVSMTFPSTGTSISSRSSGPNVTATVVISRKVERVPPFTLVVLSLIFCLSLITLNAIARGMRRAAPRRTIAAPSTDATTAQTPH